jgi:hypothetical protein
MAILPDFSSLRVEIPENEEITAQTAFSLPRFMEIALILI